MPGQLVQAAVVQRIRQSAHSLTVSYPLVRVGSAGSGLAPVPLSPLTGPPKTQAIDPPAGTPTRPAVTVKCLWYDMPTTAGEGRPQERRQYDIVGWRQGATSLARVLVSECCRDPDDPYGATIFSDCDVVTHAGQRFSVIEVTPVGAGSTMPVTLYVWLAAAVGQ